MKTLISLLTEARKVVLTETDEEPTVSHLEYRNVTHPMVSLKLAGYGLEHGSPKQVLDGLRNQCRGRSAVESSEPERKAEYETA